MITNERQYRITRAAAREFEAAMAQIDTSEQHRPPEMRQLMREAIESQLSELQDQLEEYDILRSGQVTVWELDSLAELPEVLVRVRIACGLTQRELAERLGLKAQQIQRYEATRYAGVSLERIQAVTEALGVTVQERVILTRSRVDT